jgi:hypothetical protein
MTGSQRGQASPAQLGPGSLSNLSCRISREPRSGAEAQPSQDLQLHFAPASFGVSVEGRCQVDGQRAAESVRLT